MKAKKYIMSIVTVYLCYFTHGMQALMLSQNKENFFMQWGYSDIAEGSAAVSLAITATGLGKFISVWIGGEISDKIGRKKMAVCGGVLYIICFAGLLFSSNFHLACLYGFLAGVATSGFWDASLYPAVQEAAPRFPGSALIGIKLFVSLAGIAYPLMAVRFSEAGSWHMNILIPLVLSILCVIVAVITPFVYDDQMKEITIDTNRGQNAAQLEIEAAKAKQLVRPSVLANFSTMFYGFLCMFIMYGAQQYTKAFGMYNCGLSEMQSAALTSVYTFGSVIAVIFWAVMMAKLKWNPIKVVLIDSIFTSAALVIVLLVQNVTVIYIGIALLGFFAAGGALQTGLGVRQLICPGPKGRNTGIYYTWMGFASFFLPYIVSYMTKSIGEEAAIYTMMTLLLAASAAASVMMMYLVSQYKKIYGINPLAER